MDQVKAFRHIWNRVCNKSRGSRDIEVFYLIRAMVDSLLSQGYDVGGYPTANWLMAYVSICGKAHPLELELSWSEEALESSGYVDEDGYLREGTYEEMLKEMTARMMEVREAVDDLLERGLLITSGDYVCLPGCSC